MKRIKSRRHLLKVSRLPCMLCGNPPKNQAHHLLRAEQRGMGRKTGDNWTVPLCFSHHQQLHNHGDEIDFFELNGFDYEAVKEYAINLWGDC